MKSVSGNGKQSTRETILHHIKTMPEATVDQLADQVDISPVTVRHHLNALLAEGLLVTRTVRRKVGRPYYVYTLSESGHELFPKRYVRLSNRLLSEIKRRFSPEVAADLMRSVVQDIIDEHRDAYEAKDSFEDRLVFLIELLGAEGFVAQWEKSAKGEYRLTEYGCPYISVGENHSEICSFDTELMISVLQTDVTQHSCMLNGDSCCEFSFKAPIDLTNGLN